MRTRIHSRTRIIFNNYYYKYDINTHKPPYPNRPCSLSVQHAPSRDEGTNCTGHSLWNSTPHLFQSDNPPRRQHPPRSLAAKLIKEKVNYRRQGCLNKPSYLSEEPCCTDDLAWSTQLIKTRTWIILHVTYNIVTARRGREWSYTNIFCNS